MKARLSAVLAGLSIGGLVDASQLHKRDLASSPPYYPSPWMDPEADGWQDAYSKAVDFVSQLTLLEKVNLTTGVGWASDLCVGNVGSIPRLGMRGLCMQDGPVGIRFTDYNSVFPSGQLSAATFDRVLVNRRGAAIGKEHKGKGVDVLLAPVAGGIGRVPAGGRNWEGFSPDPYLTGVFMAETIKGVQDQGVIACAKHWVGNEQEHFRQPGFNGANGEFIEALSSNIDDKTMHELYMWPFADAVRAGVGAVMCAYQQVNNSYACQNSKVLNGLLKDELNFQGFVMSDWSAQHTGAGSAVAGLDMSMPGDIGFNSGTSFWGANLTESVLNGTVPAYRLDDMAARIMAAFFKVGMEVDEQPEINFSSWTLDTEGYAYNTAAEERRVINQHVDVRGGHGDLIREIAAKGTVLLKNTGSLPLDKPKFVAVVGEDAGPNPQGPNGCPDRGCNEGTLGMSWGSGTANFPYLVTPDAALQRRALEDGSRYESVLSNWDVYLVNQLVSQEDATAIVFVNANSGEGYIGVGGNAGDRNNLTLWNGGDDLVGNVSARCANTIVVIHSTGPVLVADWHENPNVTAILWAGVPGQESGNSIADVLYGRENPAGRTPFTWGPTRDSYGVDVLYEPNNGLGAPQQDFSEGVFIDYRHFDRATAQVERCNSSGAATGAVDPIFEFGFGLSYTTFGYSDLRVERHDFGEYTPTTGETTAAPTFGNFSDDRAEHVFPEGFDAYNLFIYPYLPSEDTTDLDPAPETPADAFLPPGAVDGSPQPRPRAGGAPGGNARLWDVLYTVAATVTNTGPLAGDEVPQLYVGLGGRGDPVRVLRGFDRFRLEPGESHEFRAELTRRDLSVWDVEVQDWVLRDTEKTVWVGPSSRILPLEGRLE